MQTRALPGYTGAFVENDLDRRTAHYESTRRTAFKAALAAPLTMAAVAIAKVHAQTTPAAAPLKLAVPPVRQPNSRL